MTPNLIHWKKKAMSQTNPTEFSLHDFIVHSNEIDKQYSANGSYIPGREPGDPMYVNMQSAWAFCEEIAARENKEISISDVLKLHEIMTKDIDFFEVHNASGRFRIYDVKVGGHICPPPYLLSDLMSIFVEQWNAELKNDGDPLRTAFYLHDMYESIHPFIDGNGRTGRLLLNAFLMSKEVSPVVIYFIDRYKYYEHIQKFYPEFKQFLMEASTRYTKREEKPI